MSEFEGDKWQRNNVDMRASTNFISRYHSVGLGI
jgi:hypothetical protein